MKTKTARTPTQDLESVTSQKDGCGFELDGENDIKLKEESS